MTFSSQDKARERRRGGDRSLDVTRRSDLAESRRSEVGERTLDTRRGGGGLERANSRVATLSNLVKLPFSRYQVLSIFISAATP